MNDWAFRPATFEELRKSSRSVLSRTAFCKNYITDAIANENVAKRDLLQTIKQFDDF